MAKKICLNLSGHPVPFQKIRDYIMLSAPFQIPVDALKNPTEMKKFCLGVMENLCRSEKNLVEAGQRGKLALIPPGLSSASLIVCSIIHGYFGHFPKVFWSYRSEDGFKYTDIALDLQTIREFSRVERPYLVNK